MSNTRPDLTQGCPECGGLLWLTCWPLNASPYHHSPYTNGRQSINYINCLCGYKRKMMFTEKGGQDFIFDEAQQAKIIELYVEANMSSAEVGRIMHCHATTVRSYLHRAGVSRRPVGGSRPTVPHKEMELIRFLYEHKKWNTRQIGEHMGLHFSTIRDRMKRGGIPARSRSEISALIIQERRRLNRGRLNGDRPCAGANLPADDPSELPGQ